MPPMAYVKVDRSSCHPWAVKARRYLRGVAVMIVTAAATLLVYFHGHDLWHWVRHHLDVWDAWVAIGTISLAVATAYLARQTRDEVKAATRELDLTQRSFESSTRPVLVEVPQQTFMESWQDIRAGGSRQRERDRADVIVSTGQGELYCRLPIRNVGTGLAVVRRAEMGWMAPAISWSVAIPGAIPPNEIAYARFNAASPDAAAQELAEGAETFQVTITYSDLAAVRIAKTVFLVSRMKPPGWAVVEVRLYAGDQSDPFVTLSPRI